MEGDLNSSPEQKKQPQKVQGLRTYEADIQEAIKKDNVSLTRIAMAERARDAQGGGFGGSAKRLSRKKIWAIVIIAVLIISASGITYIVHRNNQVIEEILTVQRPDPLILADTEKDILLPGVTRSSLIDTLQKEIAAPVSISTVKVLYLKESTDLYMGAKRFLRIMETDLPSGLSQALLSNFTVGVHSFDGNHAFIILKTDLYESAVTGMFAWESNLAQKFMPLLNGRALTTAENKPFKSGLIKNKDVRVLKTADDKLLIVYSFIDHETILITTNEYTVEEITKRVNAFKLKR